MTKIEQGEIMAQQPSFELNINGNRTVFFRHATGKGAIYKGFSGGRHYSIRIEDLKKGIF